MVPGLTPQAPVLSPERVQLSSRDQNHVFGVRGHANSTPSPGVFTAELTHHAPLDPRQQIRASPPTQAFRRAAGSTAPAWRRGWRGPGAQEARSRSEAFIESWGLCPWGLEPLWPLVPHPNTSSVAPGRVRPEARCLGPLVSPADPVGKCLPSVGWPDAAAAPAQRRQRWNS